MGGRRKKGKVKLHGDITRTIIGAYYDVYNGLGYGFLESVYEKALAHELRKRGLTVRQQAPIHVHYDGQKVGDYFADYWLRSALSSKSRSPSPFTAATRRNS